MERKELIDGTCPECRGPLSEVREEGHCCEYRCLVGHSYSARALLQAHSETQEKVLWSAVVALREAGNLVSHAGAHFPPAVRARLEEQAEKKRRQADEISGLIERLEAFQVE